MAEIILKAKQVKDLACDGLIKSLNDGGGLRIVIKPKCKMIWEFKYTFEGLRNETSLGTYPKVSLASARAKAKAYRYLIEQGINPIEKNKEARQKKQDEKIKEEHTIEKILSNYLELKQHNKKTKDITLAKERGRIKNHFIELLPLKEKTIIHDITFDKIVELLKKIEGTGKLETLTRVKHMIIEIFKYAYTENILKSPEIFAKLEVKSFKSQSREDIRSNPTLTADEDIKRLYNDFLTYPYAIVTRYALLFTIHTAQRQGSIINAKWCDIDFENSMWNIPASQMKTKKEHNLPLSKITMQFLKELYEMKLSTVYLFPNSQFGNAHMSDSTVNNAIRRLGYAKDEQTAHGLRAMFKTVCKHNQEKYNLKNEFVEKILAHKTAGTVEAIYNRSNNTDEMRFIVEWWSDYLDGLKE